MSYTPEFETCPACEGLQFNPASDPKHLEPCDFCNGAGVVMKREEEHVGTISTN